MKLFRDVTISGATPTLRRGVRHIVHLVLSLERAPCDTRLNLAFVSAAHMRQLNCRYKGVDRPTDVLTFSPASETGGLVNHLLFSDTAAAGGDGGATQIMAASSISPSVIRSELVDLGDIFLSLDYMQARCNRFPSTTLPLAAYVNAALVHALLHALGHDHTSPNCLQQMARREQRLGRQLAMIVRQHPQYLLPLDVVE
ncbi:hypothetical protein NESM_000561700 [Novymonas esmeraldas]|uniref:rRNA maturation factor n=1 Tax=Novymonas esmeraldas TaxID=1808958 RepID=A0AAW0ERC6_9TRYP